MERFFNWYPRPLAAIKNRAILANRPAKFSELPVAYLTKTWSTALTVWPPGP